MAVTSGTPLRSLSKGRFSICSPRSSLSTIPYPHNTVLAVMEKQYLQKLIEKLTLEEEYDGVI